MAVSLTVSEIRQALAKAGGQPGDGAASSAAIGMLFHQVLGELLNGQSSCNLAIALGELDPDFTVWKERLRHHVYDQLLGPLLTRRAATLQSQGKLVLDLWTSIQHACDFLAEVWWEITDEGKKSCHLKDWLSPEQEILCEVNRPTWREPVAILGRPDAVLRIPQKNHWCVLEWKLGRASPEVDLGQACLYHLILGRATKDSGQSALALAHFRPELEQHSFTAHQLVDAQAKLLDLIGQMAGVSGVDATGKSTVTSRNGSSSIPRQTVPLKDDQASAPPNWQADLGEKLLKVLRQFGAPCKECKPPVIGPTFARFFIFPERGITQRKVLLQADQLHLHLALDAPPNMDVVDGAIVVDLPRPDRVSIPFSMLESDLPATDSRLGCSQVPIGVDLNGAWSFCDLAAAESAHLLVVGTPGSGKSQWLRVAIASLLRTNTPETLQLLIIDPKRNAFTFTQSSSYLRRPIVAPDDEEPVADILGSLIAEMDRRYSLFSNCNAQSLSKYLEAGEEPLARIVCVCDEYADLLLHAEAVESKAARKEIEKAFQRLVSKGRAAGIHIILATQYPSREIVTSAIQNSIGAKVALRVSSPLESRVALSANGAERLLGHGDLLYKCIGDPVRLQGAWLPEHEENLVVT